MDDIRKVVVFDSETTDVVHQRIVDAAILFSNNGRIMHFNELVNPQVKIPIQSTSVHNVTDDMVQDKPKFKDTDVCMYIESFNRNPESILVCHGVNFQKVSLELSGCDKITMKLIDVKKVAQNFYENGNGEVPQNYGLNYLRYFLNLNDKIISLYDSLSGSSKDSFLPVPHNSGFDVLIIKCILDHFLMVYTLDQMIEITSLPAMMHTLRFGKHKGKSLTELAMTEYDYLKWLYDSEMKKCVDKSEDPKKNVLILSLTYYLDKYDPEKAG